jgi:hypothetical protein
MLRCEKIARCVLLISEEHGLQRSIAFETLSIRASSASNVRRNMMQ